MNLNIEFTGRITANDDEIRNACERAREVIESSGKTVAEAWADQQRSIENKAESSELWTQAEHAATAEMGEGSSLVAF